MRCVCERGLKEHIGSFRLSTIKVCVCLCRFLFFYIWTCLRTSASFCGGYLIQTFVLNECMKKIPNVKPFHIFYKKSIGWLVCWACEKELNHKGAKVAKVCSNRVPEQWLRLTIRTKCLQYSPGSLWTLREIPATEAPSAKRMIHFFVYREMPIDEKMYHLNKSGHFGF